MSSRRPINVKVCGIIFKMKKCETQKYERETILRKDRKSCSEIGKIVNRSKSSSGRPRELTEGEGEKNYYSRMCIYVYRWKNFWFSSSVSNNIV